MKDINKNEYEKIITEFKENVLEYSPLIMLKSLYLYYYFGIRSKHEDIKFSNEKKVIFSSMINYIINIYQSKGYEYNNDKTIDDLLVIKSLIDKFTKIYTLNTVVVLETTEQQSDFGKFLKENSEGISYPFITVEVLSVLLEAQNVLITKTFNEGVTTEDLYKLAARSISVPKNIDFNKRIEIYLSNINDVLPDSFFDVSNFTKLPDSLLSKLSYKLGEAKEYFDREMYPGYLNIESPTFNKPFITIDNKYYSFHFNTVFDNLYRQIRIATTQESKDKILEWNVNQQQVTEKYIAHLISSKFKNPKVYTSNIYRIKKGHEPENDIIIECNDVLLVIEVKGGSYTPRSILFDKESHDVSIKNLIDNPISQSERFINKLEQDGKITITDNEGNFKAEFLKDKYTYVYGLAVSIEHMNELTSIYYKKDESKFSVIPFSIYDLFILIKYFDTSIEFVDYLKFRSGKMPKQLMVSDELTHLNTYITQPYIYESISKEFGDNIGSILLDPSNSDLDSYFSFYPKLDINKKPKREMSKLIKKVIKQIDKMDQEKKYKIGTVFLQGSKKQQSDFVEKLKELSFDGTKKKKTGFATIEDIGLAVGLVINDKVSRTFIDTSLTNMKNNNVLKNYLIIKLGKNSIIKELEVGNL